jgi:7-carboxy-7-deazaguanine synthase
MRVVEIFQSIDGEALRAGYIANFIRLSHCNLRCVYCDTVHGQNLCDGIEMSVDEVLEKLDKGIKNVTLTGGEPLLHKDNAYELLGALIANNYNVSVETNGSINLKEFIEKFPRVSFVMDYKSPYSGMENQMDMSNFNYLRSTDCVKFVVGSKQDLEVMKKVCETTELSKGNIPVFVSPVFDKIELPNIVDFLKEKKLNNIRMQIQMHKVIWDPNKTGV